MILHLWFVEFFKLESGAEIDGDGVVPPIEGAGGLERDPLFELDGGVEIAADEDELIEDALQLLRVRVDYLVFLKSF